MNEPTIEEFISQRLDDLRVQLELWNDSTHVHSAAMSLLENYYHILKAHNNWPVLLEGPLKLEKVEQNLGSEFSDKLRDLADNHEFMWNVPRKAIEDVLVEFRDSGLSFPFRNNGLVIKYPDGSPCNIVRMGPEDAVSIGLRAIADYLDENGDV